MKQPNRKSFWSGALAVMAASFLFAACTEPSDPDTTPDLNDSVYAEIQSPYSAMFTVGGWPNVAYYIIPIDSLMSGEINVSQGVELSAELYAQDVPQRNGFYYHAKTGAGTLGKYHVKNGVLITDKKVPFTAHGISAYVWKDDETLVAFGMTAGNARVKYSVINIKNLTIVKTDSLAVIAPPDTIFTRYALGAVEYRGGKIFLNYTLGPKSSTLKLIHGKGYVAVMDFATMAVEKNLQSPGLKSASGPSVYAQTSFQTENGDIYFVTDPGYISDTVNVSRVHRILANSTDLDTAYNFNLSASINGGMGAAMWYIGGGKAIVRYREIVKNIDAAHSFGLVNVQTGAFIKKLDLPNDVAERMIQAVIVVNGKAYIAVTTSGDDYIWEYNPATDVLTRGARLVGADIVKRLENLQ